MKTFRRGLDSASLEYQRSALPPAIAAQGGAYNANVEESHHIYEIRLARPRRDDSDAEEDLLFGACGLADFVDALLESDSSDEELEMEACVPNGTVPLESPPMDIPSEVAHIPSLVLNDGPKPEPEAQSGSCKDNILVQVTSCTIYGMPHFVSMLAGITKKHGWGLKAGTKKTERPSHSHWFEHATVVFKLNGGRDRLDSLNKVSQLRPDQWLSTCIGLGLGCHKDRFELLCRKERRICNSLLHCRHCQAHPVGLLLQRCHWLFHDSLDARDG